MPDDTERDGRDFEALLNEMPRIADAVNSFTDAAVQQQALEALVASFRGGTAGGAAAHQESARPPKRRARKRAPKTNGDEKPKRRRGAGQPTWDKSLDLSPKGKQSFKDFLAQATPTTQDEKNVASVYWLAEVAEISPVTIDHVYSCYRAEGWTEPKNFANRLAVTASRKGFLDTQNADDIKLVPQGRNYVRQVLLAEKKGDK